MGRSGGPKHEHKHETRVLFLELQDTVNTGDADRVGTVGERLS